MMDILTIFYINLNTVDISLLMKKLHAIGFQEMLLSDINFCPYLIVHKDFETNKIPMYDNISLGFLKNIQSKCLTVECNNIDDFISNAKSLFINKADNSLF